MICWLLGNIIWWVGLIYIIYGISSKVYYVVSLLKVSVGNRPIALGKERAIFGSPFYFLNISFLEHLMSRDWLLTMALWWIGVIVVIMWLFF